MLAEVAYGPAGPAAGICQGGFHFRLPLAEREGYKVYTPGMAFDFPLEAILPGGAAIALRPQQPGDAAAIYEAVDESRVELAPWMPWCHKDYAPADSQTWAASRPKAWEQG